MNTKIESAAISIRKPPARRANLLSGGDWLKRSFSIWRDLGKNPEERKLRHPAMFTVGLVARILEVYTRQSGALLDPFAGSGTALLAAMEKNMDAIGCDINPEFRRIFERRATLLSDSSWQYHVHDARRLGEIVPPESADICVTSPPYWDILNRRRSADGKNARPYSAMSDDLGNIKSYREFMDSLGKTLAGVRIALKPKAPLVLNVMDLRKGSEFYPLHMDATETAQKNGFVLEDIIIWDRQSDYNNQRPLGYPYKFIVNKVHEYLLIFR